MSKCICKGCGNELDIEHKGECPQCCETGKSIFISVQETLTFHDCLEGKVKNPEKRKAQGKKGKSAKKPTYEFFHGDDYSHSLNKHVHKERIIDRDNDLYSEIVIEVVHI